MTASSFGGDDGFQRLLVPLALVAEWATHCLIAAFLWTHSFFGRLISRAPVRVWTISSLR